MKNVNLSTYFAEVAMLAAMLPHCTLGDSPDWLSADDFAEIWSQSKGSQQARESWLILIGKEQRAAVAATVHSACTRLAATLLS